jgi:DNA polymerase III subunit delta'
MRFSEIPGNEETKQKLVRTFLDQRVSHAQLFYSPEGSDKLALAIAYAQLINCKNPVVPSLTGRPAEGVVADSCGICPSCIKYQKLIHPDLHFIYPVSTTKKVTKKPKSKEFIEEWRAFLLQNNFQAGIHEWYEFIGIENKQGIINAEDCHEIISTLSYKSYESEYKVMIIWMVEKLYYAAAPKLLKILEEPPEKTLFILVSDDPDQIISTIRSRTLMVRIPMDQAGEREPGDPNNFTLFRSWMRLCFRKDVTALVGWSGEIAKSGRENQKSLLQYALMVAGSANSFNYGVGNRTDKESEEARFIKDIAPFMNARNILQFSELFTTAIHHIERNAHAPTLFLDVSLQAIRLFHSASKKME